jgi:YhcH/YjgK/YiaL family protein
MIIDKLENASKYYAVDPDIECALRYLVEHKNTMVAEELGEKMLNANVKIMFREYNTVVGSRKWEAHEQGTDIQYIVRGAERVGFNYPERMMNAQKQKNKDQILYDGDGDRILLTEGYFMILFPGEVHMSKLAAYGVSEPVRKTAFKITNA